MPPVPLTPFCWESGYCLWTDPSLPTMELADTDRTGTHLVLPSPDSPKNAAFDSSIRQRTGAGLVIHPLIFMKRACHPLSPHVNSFPSLVGSASYGCPMIRIKAVLRQTECRAHKPAPKRVRVPCARVGATVGDLTVFCNS